MNNQTWLINFGEKDDETTLLVENIKRYARIEGVTQKRLFLIGIAQYMSERGNGGELIEQIADYLARPRKNEAVRKRVY